MTLSGDGNTDISFVFCKGGAFNSSLSEMSWQPKCGNKVRFFFPFALNFGETVLEEKLFSRAPLRDSEPSRAANAISDVFLVNWVIKHGTGERVEE